MALNPALYAALTSAIEKRILGGKLPVLIKNPGQTNQLSYYNNALAMGDPKKTKPKVRMLNVGESYWVCCPFCRDHRPRLCINHAWGTLDPTLGEKLTHYVHCFNEECQSHVDGFSRELEAKLAMAGFFGGGVTVAPNTAPTVREPVKVIDPGPCVRLDELPPTHQANQFLRTKGHDPIKLARNFGVSYCISSRMAFADNRIIFPVIENNAMCGWQARYVDTAGGGESYRGLWCCIKCKTYHRPAVTERLQKCPACQSDSIEKVPKYWTMPGFRKSEHVGNLDTAKQWPFVVICEGPTDPIHLGTPEEPDVPGPGVFLFGHSLSPPQRKLVYENFNEKAVVLLLDPDAYKDQDNIYREMKGCYKGGVAPVLLPDGRDPGECPHHLLWQMIEVTAHKEGLLLGVDPERFKRFRTPECDKTPVNVLQDLL